MQTVLVPPNSDAGPNQYGQNPLVPGFHHRNVDEDPHDGTSTRLIPSTSGKREVWGLNVSAIPDGSQIVTLKIKSAQSGSASPGNTYRVGFRINGADHFSPNHVLGTSTAFVVANDEVAADPSDGVAWTKERLARAFLVHEQVAMAVGLPRPMLTQCVVLADIIPPPDRPRARTASGSPYAAPTAAEFARLKVRVSSAAPRAVVSSPAPTVTVSSPAPRSEET